MLAILAVVACCPCAKALATTGAPGISIRFAPLRPGDTIVQRVDESERNDWVLPPEKLERFAAAGVIIHEYRLMTTVARGAVVRTGRDGTVVRVSARTDTLDVPRNNAAATSAIFDVTLTPYNEPVTSGRTSVEQAAIAGIPFRSGSTARIGQHWQTRVGVTTTLGTGEVAFDHQIVSSDGRRLQIQITGRGAVTGSEYHLPKLLPGTIDLVGAAWYDTSTGMVTQESYAIHTTLLKSPHGQRLGFDEHRTVDATARLIRFHGPG